MGPPGSDATGETRTALGRCPGRQQPTCRRSHHARQRDPAPGSPLHPSRRTFTNVRERSGPRPHLGAPCRTVAAQRGRFGCPRRAPGCRPSGRATRGAGLEGRRWIGRRWGEHLRGQVRAVQRRLAAVQSREPARRSFACTAAGLSATSSRNRVPPFAARNCPGLPRWAPVKAPSRRASRGPCRRATRAPAAVDETARRIYSLRPRASVPRPASAEGLHRPGLRRPGTGARRRRGRAGEGRLLPRIRLGDHRRAPRLVSSRVHHPRLLALLAPFPAEVRPQAHGEAPHSPRGAL
jgi:hypothetical protein